MGDDLLCTFVPNYLALSPSGRSKRSPGVPGSSRLAPQWRIGRRARPRWARPAQPRTAGSPLARGTCGGDSRLRCHKPLERLLLSSLYRYARILREYSYPIFTLMCRYYPDGGVTRQWNRRCPKAGRTEPALPVRGGHLVTATARPGAPQQRFW